MKTNQFFRKEIKILSQGIMKGALSLSVASLLLFASCSKDEVIAEAPIEQNKSVLSPASTGRTGGLNNYFYSIDAENNFGSINITSPRGGGNFNFTWNGVRQVVGGLGWSSTQRRTVNYNIGYVSPTNVKFVGVYGWTKNPLTEYYVCERGPGAIFNGQVAGNNYTANGHTYAIKKNYRNQQASIDGTASFWQVESRWGSAAYGVNQAVNMATHLDNMRGAMGGSFGLTLNGARCYMVFGCEAYDYNNNGNNRITGSMNATIW
jgi:endo-1,4-beta-xylanase